MPGRDNGFVARHYVPLADLDPRLADAMLEALRAEGIAAYIVPSTGSLGGYLEVHLPERPRDRLWVDRDYHERAATLLSAHSERPDVIAATGVPGPGAPAGRPDEASAPPAIEPVSDEGADPGTGAGGDSVDDAWAQLVAGFDLPAYEGRAPLELPAETADTPGDPPPVPRRIVRAADMTSDAGTPNADDLQLFGDVDPLSILDEHFVPEPPPPLPRLRSGTRWALAAILVGLALIVGRSFTDAVPDAVALGVLAIVGGFVGLVAMMREDRPSDSDPDDGAVV
jgi:hypothetical protein